MERFSIYRHVVTDKIRVKAGIVRVPPTGQCAVVYAESAWEALIKAIANVRSVGL